MLPPDRFDPSYYMVRRGNINVTRPRIVHNPDGSISTVESMSFGTPQGEVVVPTVWDGQHHSHEEAVARYYRTGKHLGIFSTVAAAEAYAKGLHILHQILFAHHRRRH